MSESSRHAKPETLYEQLVSGRDDAIPWPTRVLLLARWRSSQGSGMAQDVINCLPRDDRENVEALFLALQKAVQERPIAVQRLLVSWDASLRDRRSKGLIGRVLDRVRKRRARRPSLPGPEGQS